jgi:hypothetical protein
MTIEEKKKKGDSREKLFPRQDVDETLIAHSVRPLGILALLKPPSGNKPMKFLNRDLNTAMSIGRWVVLKSRDPRS